MPIHADVRTCQSARDLFPAPLSCALTFIQLAPTLCHTELCLPLEIVDNLRCFISYPPMEKQWIALPSRT